MTDKTKLDAPEEHDGRADRGNGADVDTTAVPAEDTPTAAGQTASQPKQPLITAIEIENFKGIGAPVRIDLRPITLLFGRNSAGKSTILQALCYAHEILSHGNADAHKTELGGDQIDLGGFRQFVHGHNFDRVVRLRIEMNLQNWQVPEPVQNAMEKHVHDPYDPFEAEGLFWLTANDPTQTVRSGSVTLTIGRSGPTEQPMLTSYEVAINRALFGRIVASDIGPPKLVLNWEHALLARFRPTSTSSSPATANHVAEAASPMASDYRLLTRSLSEGQQTPLPDWDSVLRFSEEEWLAQPDMRDQEKLDLAYLDVYVSGLLVGIGRCLRDELKCQRYLGPVRELRPHPNSARDPHRKAQWSDGSAAWTLLAHYDSPSLLNKNDPIDTVNEWLVRTDRLDAGYKLRRHTTLSLPAEESSIGLIRIHERHLGEFRDNDGVVDLDEWVGKEADNLAALYGLKPSDVAAHIKTGRDHASESPSPQHTYHDSSVIEHVESAAKMYQLLAELASRIARLENGHPHTAIKELVRAIAKAETHTSLQLVVAGTGLDVRTSDIGVGISQILPVVVAALDPERPGITTIEQPELHVHPKMQVELGDLLAQGVDHGGIFLIETHSEHLILRLLRRIEETHGGDLPEGKPPLNPEQLSVVFLEQIDGEVTARQLRVDETGEFIDRWPQGFFRERAAELF